MSQRSFAASKRSATAITIALLLVLGTQAFAAVINSTTLTGNQLTIAGTGFSGTPLTVTLNGKAIAVVSSTATRIIATLSPIPLPGSYRLVVRVSTTSASSYVAVSTPAILSGFCNGTPNAFGFVIGLFGLGQTVTPACNEALFAPSAGIPMASSGTLVNLTVVVSSPCSLSGDGVFTAYVNGAATSLACTVGTNVSCNDAVHQVPLKQGDLVEIRFGPNQDQNCPNSPRATVEKK